ncbi:patatin-like phospholipase family protein [Helicovermis profundi]|uniref:Patatin-like phospholipase family protein n=1 Tax=Helicovermis profundi TaxID=3065157 RepID=A0AAU9EE37_9FIRM|nr:patatin-like phospholipase family protein [Clostridia bacterium S502]
MNEEGIKKVGIAFGGGGAKSFAHIGVINVLRENNIPIDFIATCSAGSMIGALIANGIKSEIILNKFSEIVKRLSWFRPTISKKAILSQRNFGNIISDLCGNINIEDLNLPMKIIATNLNTGKLHVFSSGNLKNAVTASSAFPGMYKPVKIGECFYVDGGLLDSIPADVCRDEVGNEGIVISISLDGHLSRQIDKINIFSMMYRAIYIPLINNREKIIKENSDIVIKVFEHQEFNFRNWREIFRFYSSSKMENFIKLGEEAAREQIDEIKAALYN